MCLAALISGAAALQVCHALDVPLHHASRLVLALCVLVLATFLLDRVSPHRDHVLLPAVAGLIACSLPILWRLELAGVGAAGSRQMWWTIVGAVALVATYVLVPDVRRLARYKYLCGIGAILLIVVTMAWGHEVNGARLWVGLPGLLTFQPTELAKILICIFLAGYIAAKGDMLVARGPRFLGVSVPEMRYVAPLLLVVMFSLMMFVRQRDLGAAVLVFGVVLAMVYLATGRKTYVVLGVLLFLAGGVAANHAFPHVHRRVDAWLNPWADPTASGFQILQSLFCFGEGGVVGTGLGQGLPDPRQLPAAHTDLAISVVGEELGLAGLIVILLLAAMVAYRSFAIAWNSRDRFGSLLAAALSTTFALQTLVIVGGATKLIPLTGITFPFVSYGGTSVLANFVSMGLLLCVSRDCAQPEVGAP
ncbi:MAG: cell division protein FtsW [Armatimonadetes bacterium]|nr:cell division protein FtsW [Armatimonadota bacterium]